MRRFARRALVWAIGLAILVALVWGLGGVDTGRAPGHAIWYALGFALVVAVGAAAVWWAWRRPSRRG